MLLVGELNLVVTKEGASLGSIIRIIVYTVITFVATVLLTIETPATGGYFNLGEAAIYTIAFIAPPTITAIASGLGPSLADLALGYWYFAPATFVIKFCEGYVVSKLIHIMRNRQSRKLDLVLRASAIILAIALASIIVALLSLGGGAPSIEVSWTPTAVFGASIAIPNLKVVLPAYAWIAISVTFIAMVITFIFLLHKRPYAVAMAIGGLIMVTGYFLYEFFVSNPLILHREAIGAVFEIPVNIGQFVAGIVLAYPLVQFIERARGTRG